MIHEMLPIGGGGSSEPTMVFRDTACNDGYSMSAEVGKEYIVTTTCASWGRSVNLNTYGVPTSGGTIEEYIANTNPSNTIAIKVMRIKATSNTIQFNGYYTCVSVYEIV